MKKLLLLLFIGATAICFGQSATLPDKVPYGENPIMPTKEILDNAQPIDFDLLTEKKDTISIRKIIRFYSFNNNLYNGWALKVFKDTDHRYRYTKFENGLAVWQVAFYDDKTPDHDFHMKDGYGCGSQKMWMKDGKLYIDNYYLEGDIPHGPQFRWYTNGQLARDALFKSGALVYEILFDKNGAVENHKGTIPHKYQLLLPKEDSSK